MISIPAIEAGLALGACSVVIGIAMRFTSGPLLAKVSAAGSLAACAVGAPWLINTMQGSPKLTTFTALPHCITIEAIAPDDASKTAILILKDDDGHKRAYQLVVDDRLHDGLISAQDALLKGDPAVLCKEKKKNRSSAKVDDDGVDGTMKIDSSLALKNLKGH